jgi:prepilin-type N-terminal cleavage/methylation domain-containing protein
LKLKFLAKSNKGFTLAEMIISVALIAIMSIFILQLFITTRNLNQKAYDIDKAVSSAGSVLELFKSTQDPFEISKSKIMKYALISRSGNELDLDLLLDNNWNVIQKPLSQKNGSNEDKISFLLKAKIYPSVDINADNSEDTALYNMSISVVKYGPYLREQQTETELYTVSTAMYFSKLREK